MIGGLRVKFCFCFCSASLSCFMIVHIFKDKHKVAGYMKSLNWVVFCQNSFTLFSFGLIPFLEISILI